MVPYCYHGRVAGNAAGHRYRVRIHGRRDGALGERGVRGMGPHILVSVQVAHDAITNAASPLLPSSWLPGWGIGMHGGGPQRGVIGSRAHVPRLELGREVELVALGAELRSCPDCYKKDPSLQPHSVSSFSSSSSSNTQTLYTQQLPTTPNHHNGFRQEGYGLLRQQGRVQGHQGLELLWPAGRLR